MSNNPKPATLLIELPAWVGALTIAGVENAVWDLRAVLKTRGPIPKYNIEILMRKVSEDDWTWAHCDVTIKWISRPLPHHKTQEAFRDAVQAWFALNAPTGAQGYDP